MLVSTRFPCQMMFVLLNTNTTGVISGAGTTKPSGVSEFTPVFVGFVLFDLSFSVFCFVDRCSFDRLYCLAFFDLRILTDPFLQTLYRMFVQKKRRYQI